MLLGEDLDALILRALPFVIGTISITVGSFVILQENKIIQVTHGLKLNLKT